MNIYKLKEALMSNSPKLLLLDQVRNGSGLYGVASDISNNNRNTVFSLEPVAGNYALPFSAAYGLRAGMEKQRTSGAFCVRQGSDNLYKTANSG